MRWPGVCLGILLLVLVGGCSPRTSQDALQDTVLDVDRRFSRAAATKDVDAFANFIAEDAVFFGANEVARGRDQVLEQWEPLLDSDRLPEMSWAPEHVEVAASGDLALTRGRYRISNHVTEEGARDVTGYYVTVWRQKGGSWKVVCQVGTPPEK